VKLHLRDRHEIWVLLDMTGPVTLNGDKAFAAISRSYDPTLSDDVIAGQIAKYMDEIGHNAFAFYHIDDSTDVKKIRFGTIKI
jgi:hypothetical protein